MTNDGVETDGVPLTPLLMAAFCIAAVNPGTFGRLTVGGWVVGGKCWAALAIGGGG